jgi:tetratricopeptide (TPR) repeat protein
MVSASQHPGPPASLPPDSSSLQRVERLRAEAEACLWYAPRRGWELAQAAYAAVQELAQAEPGEALLQAECALTLAVALNALGRFAEAVPLLHTTAEQFLALDRRDRASRCHSELALAYTYLAQFEAAQTALAHARDSLADLDDPLAQARCDRAEGLFYIEQNRYPEAAALLRKAGDTFAAAGHAGEVALVWSDLAYALSGVDPQEALIWLGKARRIPGCENSIVHTARCDRILAIIYDELNSYAESLTLFRQAQLAFAREGLDFMTAWCDLSQGIIHYRLNQYDEALQFCIRARASYAAQALNSHVARCDLNIAVVYYAMNHYSEALVLYQRVADDALAEGRVLRAARCHTNMGLCYDRLGRYDQALILHDRARQAFLEAGSPLYAALCQENLAGTYRRLGRHQEALAHYRQARETFAGQGLPVYMARCDTHLADLYLALGQHAEALTCLEQARATCQQQGLTLHVAACDREMARALAQMGREDQALAVSSQARAVFAGNGLLVDAALCDLAAGETSLARGEPAQAESRFSAALAVLDPGFPDEAWRARYGLGGCALAQGDQPAALAHWLSAVAMTRQTRATLPTERLSGGFFADRRPLYEATLRLALEVGATEQALVVAEASKAQAFLGWAGQPDWRDVARDDAYLVQLAEQEERLRREMELLRRETRLLQVEEAGPILRSAEGLRSDQSQSLARLAALSQEYEDVVERLRAAASRWLEVDSTRSFSAEALRQAATGHLPPCWACLAYYLLDDSLVIFYLDSHRLTTYTRPLGAYDRLVLRQATDPTGDFRDLIYRGTLRGYRVPNDPGRAGLQRLYQLLIPPEVEALGDDAVLIIAPHGPLHGLPFHALLTTDQPLVAQVPLAYVPSLGALQALLTTPQSPTDEVLERPQPAAGRVLACGLSDFGAQARPLPGAADEVAVLRQVLGDRLDVLWGPAATREALLHLNETGELAGYDVIHLAAHAVLDRLAPSQSRILLADESLTFADILNLRLRARLVVLSACEGALGQGHPGDELMALARAFFFAGARSVVASLWRVEDASSVAFMARFYRAYAADQGVAKALRTAQRAMSGEGYLAYQWAPFVAIGLP